MLCFFNQGLRYGFMCGVDLTRMRGHRWFRNYPSAEAHKGAVVKAIMKRVAVEKTLDLGVWNGALGTHVRSLFSATAIFPMGAVEKDQLLEPGAARPTDDHTRTGLNAATDLSFLGHSLDTYNEIAWFLKQDYFMRVSDVDAAFPMLPFHPDLWRFMFFRFYATPDSPFQHLFVHLCGDFGTSGMPGVFKMFFVDVVVNMARSVQVLTLPLPVYVDDCALIGAICMVVDAEMAAFHAWAEVVCGVYFKVVKDKQAARTQLMLGFVWDSRTLTRSLEERKFWAYLEMLLELSGRSTLTLREMQSAAGKLKVRRSGFVAPGGRSARAGLWGIPGGLAGLGLSKEVTGTVIQALNHPLGLSCQRTTPRNTRIPGYVWLRARPGSRTFGLMLGCSIVWDVN
jgi:hypothetical protein